MDAVKAEKERAMLRYRRLRRAAVLSRCLLEALAALSLLSWSSARLPSALALCSAVRHLPALLFHPLSAFLLGNAIIVTLVAKSSEAASAAAAPSPSSSPSKLASSGVHEHHRHRHISASMLQHAAEVAYVVYEDKAVCAGSTTAAAASPNTGRQEVPRLQRTISVDAAGSVAKTGAEEKLLRRSQSEAGVGSGGNAVTEWWEDGEEDMADDGEEFRRKIEAFIARQLRFIEREEESLLLAAKAAPATAATGGELRIAAGSQVHGRR